jgi:photosynthetic reaction center H subunit
MNRNGIPYRLTPIDHQDEERRRGGQPGSADAQLAELRQLHDYIIAEDDPDIRGWEVRTAAGLGDRTVGSVEDLIVDRDTLRVRYVLVCLDKDAVATTRDRRILVPVGIARLDDHENQLRLDGYTAGQLVGVPEFRPGKLTRRYEAIVRRRFSPAEPTAGPQARREADFYEHREFDDRALWGVRRRDRERRPYLSRRDRMQ